MNLPTNLSALDNTDDILSELQERYLQKEVDKRVQKVLRKNKRELRRLKAHIEKCLLTDNKFGYVYALNKIRSVYRQPPLTKEQSDHSWAMNNAVLIKLAKEEMAKLNAAE